MKNVSRRKFLANSSFFSFAGLVGFARFLPSLGRKKEKEKKMFVHHVFFWLKNPESAEERSRLLEGIQSLKSIETIRTAHIGKPADTDRDVIENSYDFSELLIFDSLEDQEVYQNHPTHLKFIDDCSSLWSKVVVYDTVDV